MENLPFFTTEHGTASLILREIPVSGAGYILLLGARPGEAQDLLEDCARVCRMAGARRLYARGPGVPAGWPGYCRVWLLEGDRRALPRTQAAPEPLTPERGEEYRRRMNEAMAGVPCASTMGPRELRELLARGGGWFVTLAGETVGAGQVRGPEIELLAAFRPGMGTQVLSALAGTAERDRLQVRCALENERALALYTRLGFRKVRELEFWQEMP